MSTFTPSEMKRIYKQEVYRCECFRRPELPTMKEWLEEMIHVHERFAARVGVDNAREFLNLQAHEAVMRGTK